MKAIAKIFVVVALIASTAVVSFAGPLRGPLVGTERVQARSTTVFYETFRAGELATISVAGDGDRGQFAGPEGCVEDRGRAGLHAFGADQRAAKGAGKRCGRGGGDQGDDDEDF